MKKILLLLAILSSIVAISVSCKKGPDDPFISLRSRNSRIIGTWKIKYISIDSSVTVSSGLKDKTIKYVTDYELDSVKKFSDDDAGNPKDSIYYEILTINDDGTFVDSISSKKKGATVFRLRVVKNEWYWTSSKKNKDGIVLVGFATYRVDRLAWKELIFTSYKEMINYTNKTLVYGSNITVNKEIRYKRQ